MPPGSSGNPGTFLFDLDLDCIRTIIRLLSPRDACTLAKTCTRMSGLVSLDEVAWLRFCEEQLGPRCNAALVRQQLHLGSYRSLCQVSHQLGGWPVGFWRRTDSCTEPYGELIQVHAVDGQLVGRALLPTGDVSEVIFMIGTALSATVPSLTRAEAVNYAGMPAEVALHGGSLTVASDSLPTTFWQTHGGLIHRQGAAESDDDVIAVLGAQGVADGLGHGAAHPANHLVPGNPAAAAQAVNHSNQRPDEAVGVGPLVWDHTKQKWLRMLCPLPTRRQEITLERLPQQQVAIQEGLLTHSPLPPPALHAGQRPLLSGASDALGLLSRLQGFWSACYGPHGVEIVHVELLDACQPGADRCPFGTSRRLVATKVTGDCNVPAGKVTLCTVDSNARLGRYLGFDEDDSGHLLSDRPIVAFHEDGMSYVNMAERDVAARFRARGQMNYVPGVWDPCWSNGQLLIYEDDLPCFSMLFEDDGEHFRHMIDYTPLLVH